MRLDDRKNIQSVKLAWSICVQSFKFASHPLPRGIMKDINKHTTNSNFHLHGFVSLYQTYHQNKLITMSLPDFLDITKIYIYPTFDSGIRVDFRYLDLKVRS